ncbi:MAG: DNA polymerase III subunit delta [Eubacteriales bacterium]|nr:DNA polymerase III subunit delta [Eubacteriales bacterium]
MKKINNDIKNNTLEHIYALFGNEDYLLRQFKNKFIELFKKENDINIKIITKDIFLDKQKVFDIIEAYPFFSDKKLIIFQFTDSLKKNDEELLCKIKENKDINVFLFIEDNIDYKNNIYKYILENGYSCELNTQDENTIKKWMHSNFTKEKINIDVNTISNIINKVGLSMDLLKNEMDKITSYTYDKTNITNEDIDAICIENYQNKIFDIITYKNTNNEKKCFSIYKQILLKKENGTNQILFSLLRTNYTQMIISKELINDGKDASDIKDLLKIENWKVNKILNIIRTHSYNYFSNKYLQILNLEKNIKNGDITVDEAILIILST